MLATAMRAGEVDGDPHEPRPRVRSRRVEASSCSERLRKCGRGDFLGDGAVVAPGEKPPDGSMVTDEDLAEQGGLGRGVPDHEPVRERFRISLDARRSDPHHSVLRKEVLKVHEWSTHLLRSARSAWHSAHWTQSTAGFLIARRLSGANQTNKKGVLMNLASLRKRDVVVGSAATLALSIPSFVGLLPFSTIEVAGFVTGGICVWLLVRENVWNWPVGIANSGLYFVVLLQARLFADSALQLAFVALGVAGWCYWLRGGSAGSHRAIGRIEMTEALAVAAATGACTFVLAQYLQSVGDAAPALDSLTTCLSLAATYLQARKLIENWLASIPAHGIFIPLYAWKHLPLTAVLYVLFLVMCVRGLFAWRSSIQPDVRTDR